MIPAAPEYRRVGCRPKKRSPCQRGGDDAKLLAGGMSLLPLMKLRL